MYIWHFKIVTSLHLSFLSNKAWSGRMISRSLHVLSVWTGVLWMVNRHAEIRILPARSAGRPEGGFHRVQQPCLHTVVHSIYVTYLSCGLTKTGESTAVALVTSSREGILGVTITVSLTVQVDLPPSFLLHLFPLTLGPHFLLIALGSVQSVSCPVCSLCSMSLKQAMEFVALKWQISVNQCLQPSNKSTALKGPHICVTHAGTLLPESMPGLRRGINRSRTMIGIGHGSPYSALVLLHYSNYCICPLAPIMLLAITSKYSWILTHGYPFWVSQESEGVWHVVCTEVCYLFTWNHTTKICLDFWSLSFIALEGISGSHLVYSSASRQD